MLWIPLTIGAAALQVARNAVQRELVEEAGPWGAALVRFLFGLPFALIFAIAAVAGFGTSLYDVSPRFLATCAVGGAAQIAGMGAILVSMQRSGFAAAHVFQLSSVPLAAVFGLAIGDRLDSLRWTGIGLITLGLTVLAWPRGGIGEGWSGAFLGLAAGALFALQANADRLANLALSPGHAFAAAPITLLTVFSMQSAALTTILALADRKALLAVFKAWRASLSAGFIGAAGAALGFMALGLFPVGPVRAVGAAANVPIAAFAGRRLFGERMGPRRALAAAGTLVGVFLAAVG
ncbi:MAG: EamA/RhaT family transporter [Caulobacteraceae bacterium]